VHILVVGISVILIFVNLTQKTGAEGWNNGERTILMDLIQNEVSDQDAERFTEESFAEETAISVVQQSYQDDPSAVNVQPMAADGPADEDGEEILSTTRDGGSIVRPDMAATEITKRLRSGIVTYTVESGDTISTIAEEFEVSVNTILWENGLSAYSIIRPGDKLDILPMSGISHKVARGETLGQIAKSYGAEETQIKEFNDLSDDAMLQAGQKLLIPGGKKAAPASAQPSYTGVSVIKDLAKAPSAKPVPGNMMNWPTEGHRITQYYSWRHTAVDIANKTGTPIYAADAGVVEYAGWNSGGYGNEIVIDHGGGKKTRYAHLSKFFVAAGDKVEKGKNIAAMGSTGNSTGPHLHFEVIINGIKQNPLNYIK
jgi:LysM repeat protein